MSSYAKYEMFAIMLKNFQQYFINTNLLTITTDNAKFNDTLRKHFRNKMKFFLTISEIMKKAQLIA